MKRSIWFVIPSGIGLIILLSIGLLFAFEKDNFAFAEDKNDCNYFSKKLKIAAGKKDGNSYKFAETLKNKEQVCPFIEVLGHITIEKNLPG